MAQHSHASTVTGSLVAIAPGCHISHTYPLKGPVLAILIVIRDECHLVCPAHLVDCDLGCGVDSCADSHGGSCEGSCEGSCDDFYEGFCDGSYDLRVPESALDGCPFQD